MRKLLARSGFDQLNDDSGTDTGIATPAEGPVLSRNHWMSRFQHTGNASESQEDPTKTEKLGQMPLSVNPQNLPSPLSDLSSGIVSLSRLPKGRSD